MQIQEFEARRGTAVAAGTLLALALLLQPKSAFAQNPPRFPSQDAIDREMRALRGAAGATNPTGPTSSAAPRTSTSPPAARLPEPLPPGPTPSTALRHEPGRLDALMDQAQGGLNLNGNPLARATNGAGAQLLVFVSFSMPQSSLQRLAQDASRAGAVLVFRGLQDNSMRKTRERLQGFINNASSVQINPAAFTAFEVGTVPTVLVMRPPALDAQGRPAHAKVAGDVTIDYALDYLERTAPQFRDITQPARARLKARL